MSKHEAFVREGRKLSDLRKKADSAYSAYCLVQEEVRGQERLVDELFKQTLAEAHSASMSTK
jgi:hypothetical protein